VGRGVSLTPERVLATVLFTDLVGSTEKAVALGPRWQETLREHNAAIRRELAHFHGREIDTAGDGFFASGFDGRPALPSWSEPASLLKRRPARYVSGTVKDLVAGSGIDFESGGVRELKGVGKWPLYAVSTV
jgi:class 3 adenylate cyclase